MEGLYLHYWNRGLLTFRSLQPASLKRFFFGGGGKAVGVRQGKVVFHPSRLPGCDLEFVLWLKNWILLRNWAYWGCAVPGSAKLPCCWPHGP